MTSFRRICVEVVDVSPNSLRSSSSSSVVSTATPRGTMAHCRRGHGLDAGCEECNGDPEERARPCSGCYPSQPARRRERGRVRCGQGPRAFDESAFRPAANAISSSHIGSTGMAYRVPSTHGLRALHRTIVRIPLGLAPGPFCRRGSRAYTGSHPSPCSSGTLGRQASPVDAHQVVR